MPEVDWEGTKQVKVYLAPWERGQGGRMSTKNLAIYPRGVSSQYFYFAAEAELRQDDVELKGEIGEVVIDDMTFLHFRGKEEEEAASSEGGFEVGGRQIPRL